MYNALMNTPTLQKTPTIAEPHIKEKKERGVKFSDDMLSVIFADGSSQILGEGQIKDLKRNNLSPNSLIKGFFPY
jgi:hypothetical protein